MAITQITMITVPVTDQQRSKDFYTDVLGFSTKRDFVMNAETAGDAGQGARWVMLTPPGGGADITLVTWFGDTTPPGSAKLTLGCDDADKAYAEVTARGARPNGPVQDAPWGRWFGLDDPDGNNWLIAEAP